MTLDQIARINTAIGTVCGWVDIRAEVDWLPLELKGIYTWPHPTDPEKTKCFISRKELPRYYDSLDAMHAALTFLYEHGVNGMRGGQALSVYALELDKIINRDFRGETSHRRLIATAAQCAEAFLKTLGLWEGIL